MKYFIAILLTAVFYTITLGTTFLMACSMGWWCLFILIPFAFQFFIMPAMPMLFLGAGSVNSPKPVKPPQPPLLPGQAENRRAWHAAWIILAFCAVAFVATLAALGTAETPAERRDAKRREVINEILEQARRDVDRQGIETSQIRVEKALPVEVRRAIPMHGNQHQP